MINGSKQKRVLSKRRKDMIFVACLVFVPLMQYFVFYICVNFNSILLAFQQYNIGDGETPGRYVFAGFVNFKKIYDEFISDGLILSCVKNSLMFYLINLVVGTGLGLTFSYYIARKRFASKLFKLILFMPSIISSIVLVTLFKYFANYAVPQIINNTFGTNVKALISTRQTAFGSIVFYNIWAGFGTAILLYSGAMSNVSESVIEAAKIDGAGPVREFIHVVLPLIFPTFKTFIVNGVAIVFASDMCLFSFFGTDAERYLWTFGYYLLRGARLASLSEYPYLAAIGVVLTMVCVPLTFSVRYLLTKYGPSID
ncbi:MAG: sugar ABC transporter permease [Clostridia bacterium]|nr:sugar ABC transporter permease [Clostridia bacterium]